MSREQCPSCKGEGCWEDDGAGGPCARCDGKGYLPAPQVEGASESDLPCSRCGRDIGPGQVVFMGGDMKPRHWVCPDE